jgi:hypothetical protein
MYQATGLVAGGLCAAGAAGGAGRGLLTGFFGFPNRPANRLGFFGGLGFALGGAAGGAKLDGLAAFNCLSLAAHFFS